MDDDLRPQLEADIEAERQAALRAKYPLPAAPEKQGFNPLQTAAAVGKDVAQGAAEFPRAVVGGALDAVQATLDLAGSFEKQAAVEGKSRPGVQILDPETKKLNIKLVDLAEIAKTNPEAIGLKVPDLAEPDSTTGKLVEGMAQFLTGFAGAGKLAPLRGLAGMGGAGGVVARGAIQGAIADFAVFDPQEERLANLIESVPALQNPVTAYLAADEDDGEIEGRIKNVIEGAGVGIPVDAFLQGLRVMRSARTARKSLEDIEQMPAEIMAAKINGEKMRADYEAALGSVEKPLFEAKVRGLDAGQAEAQGLVAAANRFRDAVATLQPERFAKEGDLADLRGLDFSDVDAMMRMVDEVRAPSPKIKSLTQFLKEEGGLLNEGDEVITALGSTKARPGLMSKKGLDLDEATLRAWQAGYLPQFTERPSPNALIDALRDDLAGRSVFRDKDQEVAALLEARKSMEDELERLGVNYTDRSKKRIREQIERVARVYHGEARTLADLDAEAAERVAVGADNLSELQRADLGGQDVYVNFAKIETEDDVRSVIGQMADAYASEVDAARGGAKVSVKAQKLSAEQIDAFDTLAARRQGEPLNAAQTLAVRGLWAESAAKLKALATTAHLTPSEGNLLAFRKMMAIHHTIQKEVIAARTETARALQIWNVPVGDAAQNAKQIEDLIQRTGGAAAHRDLAKAISELGAANAKELEEVVSRGALATTADAVAEAWRFALLSGPQTHVVNGMSNTLVMLYEMAERTAASRMAGILGRQVDSVANGETAAMALGMRAGFQDSLRYASKVLRGASPDPDDFGIIHAGFEKAESAGLRAVTSENFPVFGRAADVVGTVLRAPQAFLGAADTFFKTVNWRGELYAQAYRRVSGEVRAGVLAKEDVAKRAAELVQNPTPTMLDAARQASLDRTFTNPPKPGGATSGLLALRRRARLGPVPLGHVLLPFINTPANILRYTFQRTPAAPLFAEYRAAIRAGGARAEIARTQMAMGTMIGLMATDMAMNGQISGGGPANQRQRQNLLRAGWQPYSVKFGDRWIAYNRLDPLGMTLALGADAAEIFANTDWTQENADEPFEAFALMAGSIGSNVLSKTYLSGLADFSEFMSDPQRYGERYLSRLVATALVPNIAASIRRVEDPTVRATTGVMEEIKNRVPGLSDSLAPRLDLWGQEINYQSGFGVVYDAFSPIYTKRESNHPIDKEIVRLGVELSMPAKAVNILGQNISLRNDARIYERYVALAGNEYKINGMGALDRLNAIVTGADPLSAQYERGADGPEGGKAEIIKRVLTLYRSAARVELAREFPELESRAQDQAISLFE